MLKRLIKLAFAALIVHAGWRVGTEYLTYFQFRDAVRQEILRHEMSENDLRETLFEQAERFDLPLEEELVLVERDGRRTYAEGAYVRPIEVLPGYFYPWTFHWAVEVFVVPDASDPVTSGR
jgi:hypothetical protein